MIGKPGKPYGLPSFDSQVGIPFLIWALPVLFVDKIRSWQDFKIVCQKSLCTGLCRGQADFGTYHVVLHRPGGTYRDSRDSYSTIHIWLE